MPGRLGVGWICHLLPFQRSGSMNGPEGGKPIAIAVHAEDEEHETPLKKAP